MIEGILVEGLIFGILALAVFITFRILDFPDLTVDGSFPLGAVTAGSCLLAGMHPIPALLIAFLAGAMAGTVTAVIHNKLKVPNLLAGILTMTMLYSINIRILGNRANLPLLKVRTIVDVITDLTGSYLSYTGSLLLLFLLVFIIIKVLLDQFFLTDMGLSLGAMGNNEQMIITLGVNPETMKIIGLSLSNGLVALSGAFFAQYQGFADVNMGQGVVVSGLAMVMLGEFLIRSNNIQILTFRALLGAILYKAIMFYGRYYGYYIHLTPNDLKLLTGLLIILSLIISKSKNPNILKTLRGKK
ncbi:MULTISPECIES: ABC transporter permease [unclassified Oceanispirochaeta]|uniref:ABC transporter permease n=1 Tax=unclassified Oceanispirochaeta TaxID=2635722 RepID=UPI000E0912B7|nr:MULTISPECIES: ABC transporter permease [unclassified Oceanispirochaeta]MBF9016045.1 ABC transporter permease [Oceanispirochaeta sp. M2]NPD72508.1 ABC transporter permease [Oceanispirochaeta sp. M1]RDG31966.1 ABC transporter permease [Oceanispirochaeta sp. M1]